MTHHLWSRTLALALSGLVALAPALAHAKSADDAKVEKYVRDAQKLYEKGSYKESADTLLRAYEVKPVAKLLFNVARTYDKAGEEELALRYYQRYIDAGDDAELVRKASVAVDRLRTSREQKQAAERKQREEEAAKAAAAQKEAEAAKQAAEQAQKEQEAREAKRLADEAAAKKRAEDEAKRKELAESRRKYLYLGVGTAAVGLAGMGVGTGFGLSAKSQKEAFDASRDFDAKVAARDSAQTRARVADIGFGVGAVALVATIPLLILGWPPAEAPAQAHLELAPNGVAIAGVLP